MNNLGRGKENEKKDKNKILTRETVGIVLELFAALTLLILITRSLIFGSVGYAISSFLLGVFGYSSYAVLAAWIYGGAVLITGKKFTASRKTTAFCVLCFLFFVCLVHTITADVSGIAYGSYGGYLADCYTAGGNSFFATTGGGVIIGLVVYPVVKLLSSVGGYIIFSLLMLGTGFLVYRSVKKNGAEKQRAKERRARKERAMVASAAADTPGLYGLNYAELQDVSPAGTPDAIVREVSPQQTVQATGAERSRRLYALGDAFDLKTKRELRQESRREEYERRAEEERAAAAAQQQQPLSPYAQSRQILYPDTPPEMPYRFSAAPSASSSASASSAAPSHSSYTSNGIFDSDSYFNRRRGAISGAQYAADNFGSAAGANAEPAHKAESVSQPSAPSADPSVRQPADVHASAQSAQAGATYSEMFSDGVNENISYSAVPKKIFTDTTSRQQTEFSASFSADRSDERVSSAPVYGDTEREHRQEQEQETQPSRPVREELPPPVFGAETGRRIFGQDPSPASASDTETARRYEPNEQQTERLSDDAGRSALPDGEETSVAEPREPFARDGGRELFGREMEQEPFRVREEEPVRQEEENSALRPISDDFDSAVNLFDDEETEEPSSSVVPDAIEAVSRRRAEPAVEQRTSAPVQQEQPVRKKHVYARYKAPSVDLLDDYQSVSAVDPVEIEHNKNTIVETLSDLRIPSEVVKVTQGPSVTRYDIEIPGNIPTGRVLGCDKELAMRLRAASGVNVQMNYENGTISIEVPNKQRATVGLKEILSADTFVSAKPQSLMFGIGKDIEGRSIVGDITKMIHLLVAGSTGSGKSVCLNALIISLLYKYSPEDLRIILIDPKQVEFNIYDKLPHLMINEIIYEPAKVINVLNWCINEMERRFSLFKQKTKSVALVRDIDEYNAHLLPDEEKMPKIVLIIDELADLMQAAKKDLEDRIQRLTQKSRAAGIHLVLATQRPSVDVITGVIKNNLPTRIAFKVTSGVDSQTILDENGAEKLLGKGDLLYRTGEMPFPLRVQGAFLHSDEVQRVVEYVKEHNEAYFDDSVATYINNDKSGGGGSGGDGDDSVEAVYIEALRYVVDIGQASISMIQRRCSVGYPKAGKIIEWMENMGYISAFDGARARKVLLTKEEFESKYGDYGD